MAIDDAAAKQDQLGQTGMQKIPHGHFGDPVIALMIAVALGLLAAAAAKTASLGSRPISALASEIAGLVSDALKAVVPTTKAFCSIGLSGNVANPNATSGIDRAGTADEIDYYSCSPFTALY